jgi:hypothetical protein
MNKQTINLPEVATAVQTFEHKTEGFQEVATTKMQRTMSDEMGLTLECIN